jgi:single-stranded DNA-binding protein
MFKNEVSLEGILKWEPKKFDPKQDGQKPIMVFALEQTQENTDRRSLFHCKAYGDLAGTLAQENLSQGDRILVEGRLNESKWKDKQTDEWKSRIEVWARKVEFVDRVAAGVAAGGDDFDDIPF